MYASCRLLGTMQPGNKKDSWFIYVSPGALEAVYIYVLEEKWTINSKGGIQIRHKVGLSRGED